MDPVNKWLTTIILFMIAVIIVFWYTGGSGRYEFSVQPSTVFQKHAVVYVLDTKDGSVNARLVDENDLQYNGRPKRGVAEVYKEPGLGRGY